MISFDKGTSWNAFSKNLPNVAVHDLVIQPTAKHLVVGTHGRSLYRADIASLQKMNAEVLAELSHVFAIDNIRKSRNWGRSWSQWRDAYTPEITIPFYINTNGKVDVNIYQDDVKVNSISVDADKGFNELKFDISFSKKGLKAYKKANEKSKIKAAQNDVYYLPKGKYTVKIGDAKGKFEVK